MQNDTQDTAQLLETVRHLGEAVASSERRLRRMETWVTRFGVGLLGVLSLAGYAFYSLGSSQTAHATSGGLLQRIEQDIEQTVDRDVHKVATWTHERERQFHAMLEDARADMVQAGRVDPLHSIAVLLKDMKLMLEAVPRMADRMDSMTVAIAQMNQKMSAMPAMAVDMHQMNGKMGVMSYGVGSTMGRVGNMMRWLP